MVSHLGSMILGLLSEPYLRTALRRAASPEEDVLLNETVSSLVLSQVFPRLLVHDEAGAELFARPLDAVPVPVLALDRALVARWEEERLASGLLLGRAEYASQRLRPLLSSGRQPNWVDLAFRDTSRAAGAQLPVAFKGFARRVLEYPARYDDLHGVGSLAGLSRGALKARFRRRGLASPYLHVRWLRCLAAGYVLADPAVTTLQASQRLGFTSDGNFCRTLFATTGVTPTALRSRKSWHLMVTTFASRFLGADALEAWSSLEDLFLRQAA